MRRFRPLSAVVLLALASACGTDPAPVLTCADLPCEDADTICIEGPTGPACECREGTPARWGSLSRAGPLHRGDLRWPRRVLDRRGHRAMRLRRRVRWAALRAMRRRAARRRHG